MRRALPLTMVALLAACGGAAAQVPTTAPAATTVTTTATTSTTMPMTTTVATTTTTTSPPASTGPHRGRLVIHAVGDVNFASNSTAIFNHTGFEHAWTGIREIFRRDHLTIVNFECSPSAIGSPIEKKWAFRCPLDALPVMHAAGVEITSMANNHAGDLGKAALVDGRANLLAAGLAAIGAGADIAEANEPAIFEIDGWRIAVVGLGTVSGNGRWFAGEGFPGVAPASYENITTAVGAAAAQADIVIVTVHWGEDLAPGPTGGDRQRAQAMIDAGADVIVGHHPHRLQPLEVVDGVPVFWSMGNFVWPNLGHIQATTGIAEIVIETDGTITGRIIPAYIESHGHPVLKGSPDPSLLPDRSAIE